MNKILEPYCNFHIYIIEQSSDGELFNIGKLKNIGFELASMDEKFSHYVFSDIDTIPDYDLMDYYIKTPKNVLSLAIRGTRWEDKNLKNREVLKPFLGALISFSSKLFTKINGYPNNFWGWGGEDDAMKYRLKFKNIKVWQPTSRSGFIEMKHIDTRSIQDAKNMLKWEGMNLEKANKNNSGIKGLKFKVLDKSFLAPTVKKIVIRI
jgi:hypothetical protein